MIESHIKWFHETDGNSKYKILWYERCLYDTEKNLVITLPVQNLLKDFDFDAGVTVRVEVDVFVEKLDVELGLGAAVHALGGNLHPFLQAVHHSFLVTQLQK